MKEVLIITVLSLSSILCAAQTAGYYNGTEGKKGEELKSALNDIIQDHVDFSYSDAKYVMNYTDQDPENANNIILFYTRRSQPNTSWGSGGDFANREHVWAKSHGDFVDTRPMDGDVFNLHPADASVNLARLHYDFDSVPRPGTYIEEAQAYLDASNYRFEPADISKGRVARTIFYMAVRYEGENGELNLEAIDALNTSEKAEHGKLSTLLKWNRLFPPDAFERRRNERIFECQRNRNPFIDHPEFADLIWAETELNSISIENMNIIPEYPSAGASVTVKADIVSSTSSELPTATLYWDTTFDGEANSVAMTSTDAMFEGNLDFAGIAEGSMVYYKIVVTTGESSNTLRGNVVLQKTQSLTEISAVQGTGNASPMTGQTVTIAGIVTANLDGSYYIQSSTTPYSGMCVYNIQRGHLGDSIIVTGRVAEYNNLTEMTNIEYTYVFPRKTAPEPAHVTIDQIDESYEGMLVKLSDVSFSEGGTLLLYGEGKTVHLTDGSKSIDVYNRYNSRLGGKILPAGKVDVVAVVSQYGDNFQLLINSIEDISFIADSKVPEITGVSVLSKDRIQISFSETLETTSATNKDHYTIDGGVNVLSANLSFGRVILVVENMDAKDYVLSISGVKDLQSNTMNNATFNFTSTISTGLNNVQTESLSLYPNPVSNGILNIRASSGIKMVSIVSLTGAELSRISFKSLTEAVVPVGDLRKGTYIAIIQQDDGTRINRRFVVN